MSETKETTTIIVTLSSSMRNPTAISRSPMVPQVYTAPSNAGLPATMMSQYATPESTVDTATARIVTRCAPERPITRPNSPATSAPSSGASTIHR